LISNDNKSSNNDKIPSRLVNELLGKYSNFKSNQLNRPIPKFEEAHWYPSNLLEIVSWITKLDSPKLNDTEFNFSLSTNSAEKNWNTLEKYDLSLEKAINAQSNSQLSYGSEFKKPEILEMIFLHHPLWKRLKSILSNGAKFPLESLENEEKKHRSI